MSLLQPLRPLVNPDKKLQHVIIVFLILILHFSLGIQDVLELHPQSVHQWAQCDRASVALNYYHDGMDFFHPQVHNIDNGSGITGMEFPFVNYSAAVLYKIFGFHEFLYRLLTLFIYSCGLFCVFKISQFWLNNFWQSAGVMLIFGCSPLLVFYSANFLPEPSSLSFSLIAWHLFLRYTKEKNKWNLFFAFVFLSLGCLIKLSSLVNIPAMLGMVWFDPDRNSRWKRITLFLTGTSIIVAITFSWYFYAIWLSNYTGSEIFLLQSLHAKNFREFVDVWQEMRRIWLYRIYHDYLLVGMITALLFGFVFIGKVYKSFYRIFLIQFLSVSVFMVSMWTQLRYHDYYLIPMYLIFLLGLIAIIFLVRSLPFKLNTIILFLLIPFLILIQHSISIKNQKNCYNKTSELYGWTQFDLFFDLNYALQWMGINKEDKIISVYDSSPDISLYLMDHKGVSVSFHNTKKVMDAYIYSGEFKWLIYNPVSSDSSHIFDPAKYPLKKFQEFNGLDIYQIIKPGVNKSSNTKFLFSPWN